MIASLGVLKKGYLIFSNNVTGNYIIFRVSDYLMSVDKIVEFDAEDGLITFIGTFSTMPEPIEDYVDLKDILYNLRLNDYEKEYYGMLKKEDLCVLNYPSNNVLNFAKGVD